MFAATSVYMQPCFIATFTSSGRKNPESEVELCGSLLCENMRLQMFWSLPTLVCCTVCESNLADLESEP